MTLDRYLADHGITEPDFAERIGVDQSTVNRLRKGQIPSRPVMERIVEVTAFKVTPNDFFGVQAAA